MKGRDAYSGKFAATAAVDGSAAHGKKAAREGEGIGTTLCQELPYLVGSAFST